MISTMREYFRGLKFVLLIVIVAFIATSVVYFGADAVSRGGVSDHAVASVNGEEIPVERFRRAYSSYVEFYRQIYKEGRNRVGIMSVPKIMPGAAAGQVSMAYGLRGPVFGVTSACASSNHAFSAAVDQLRLGRADVMLAGGADAPLVFGVLKSWEALRAMARKGKERLEQGFWVIVFPEGTRVAPGEHRKYQQGGAWLASYAGVPVVPIAHNAGRVWPRNSFYKYPGQVTVRIGPPIESARRPAEEITAQAEAWIEAQQKTLDS